MAGQDQLRAEFFNAKRALALSLFEAGGQYDPSYAQMALGALEQTFERSLFMLDQMSPSSEEPRHEEHLSAYAANLTDGWDDSRWVIVFVNNEPVPDLTCAPTVAQFTRMMLDDGWMIASPTACDDDAFRVPNDHNLYRLYFSRATVQESAKAAEVELAGRKVK
jgi:hypothetical protein